jgi:hypothetical protein
MTQIFSPLRESDSKFEVSGGAVPPSLITQVILVKRKSHNQCTWPPIAPKPQRTLTIMSRLIWISTCPQGPKSEGALFWRPWRCQPCYGSLSKRDSSSLSTLSERRHRCTLCNAVVVSSYISVELLLIAYNHLGRSLCMNHNAKPCTIKADK